VMTSNVWHCFCTYCTKEHRCLLHCSINLSCHMASCRAQQCWKQDQPVLGKSPTRDQDQSCKTKTKTEAGLRPVLS